MQDIVDTRTDLGADAAAWLRQLVGDWQLLSDLSFADLVLLARAKPDGVGSTEDAPDFVALAQARPSTAATVLYDDVVDRRYPAAEHPRTVEAFRSGRIQRFSEPVITEGGLIREETVPVAVNGLVIGVLLRYTNLASTRIPSRLELTYQRAADVLLGMVPAGRYPAPGEPSMNRRGAPRVGDGLFWLDEDGICVYASPNAVSALHRMGMSEPVARYSLAERVTPLLSDAKTVDESLPLVLAGKAPWHVEVTAHRVTLAIRAIPLYEADVRTGAIVLVRDLTEMRHQELELLSKQATIREVHHRVKNNLQTVSALLRLQARRIESEEARHVLEEAMRRVSTIAFVHETLAHGIEETLDFDHILDRGLTLSAGLATSAAEGAAAPRRTGSFGKVPAEDATALALVLVELVSNAVEHGVPAGSGAVELVVRRDDRDLEVEVTDSGPGLPADFHPGRSGLGTQIVEALVVGELNGDIRWTTRPEGGTRVLLSARLSG